MKKASKKQQIIKRMWWKGSAIPLLVGISSDSVFKKQYGNLSKNVRMEFPYPELTCSSMSLPPNRKAFISKKITWQH